MNDTSTSAFDTEVLRDMTATATRILARHELLGMFGHVSILLPGGEGRFLLSPGAGSRKDLVRATDIFELHVDDDFRQGLPLELYMHSEAHRLLPEVGSLVHIHAPALTLLSSLSEIPTDAMLFNGSFWPDKLPCYDRPDLVRDRGDARALTQLVQDNSLVLLRWHGAVISGQDVQEATFRAIFAEQNASLILGALAHGRATVTLPTGHERMQIYEQIVNERLLGLHWAYESSFVPEPVQSGQ